ncbi:UNVERIFIED_CONTAM: hypothetical protein HDU68_008926, partial [Siphonaria sp. JEL0065]
MPPTPTSLFSKSSQSQTNARKASLSDRDKYWQSVAKGLEWATPPFFSWSPSSKDRVLQTNGSLSLYNNLVTRHLGSNKNKTALIYDGPLALNAKGSRGVKLSYSYLQLDTHVRAVALTLLKLGVTAGDVVLIYMPMVPEAVFAMLACARVGAVHAVVFGGFAAAELCKRIQDAKPKVVIYASCGLEPNKLVPYKPAVDE